MKRLFAYTSILFLLSCSTDDSNLSNTKNIEGVWERTYEMNSEDLPLLDEGNYEHVLQFKFLSNNNFASYSFIRNTETNNAVGYTSKFQGDFYTEENRLELLYDQYSSNTEASNYVDLDELLLIQEDIEWGFNFSINQDELLFDFDPCGPSENCIGELNLTRVNEIKN